MIDIAWGYGLVKQLDEWSVRKSWGIGELCICAVVVDRYTDYLPLSRYLRVSVFV